MIAATPNFHSLSNVFRAFRVDDKVENGHLPEVFYPTLDLPRPSTLDPLDNSMFRTKLRFVQYLYLDTLDLDDFSHRQHYIKTCLSK